MLVINYPFCIGVCSSLGKKATKGSMVIRLALMHLEQSCMLSLQMPKSPSQQLPGQSIRTDPSRNVSRYLQTRFMYVLVQACLALCICKCICQENMHH